MSWLTAAACGRSSDAAGGVVTVGSGSTKHAEYFTVAPSPPARAPVGEAGGGHTALSAEDREELIPSYVTTRAQLNDAEQRNILAARRRHLRRPPKLEELLDDRWLRGLHEDMFGEVWEWAGRYRTTTTNLGIDWHQIPVAVRNLVDDAAEWMQTGRPTDQAAVGLHHRLAAIHPFVNGNGRHARLTADVFAAAAGRPVFSWGQGSLAEAGGDVRQAYLQALHAADAGDLDQLVAFARS